MFMDRGSMPSLGNSGGSSFGRHSQCYSRTYVPLDNIFVIMQMIATFIILIIGGIAYLIGYKSSIVDPIEGLKRTFIMAHFITVAVFFVILLIATVFSKNKMISVIRLVIICAMSIIAMLIFFGIKLNLDKTYTEDKFKYFYAEQNIAEKSNSKLKVDIGLTGVSLKSDEEYYIDQCMKLYNNFKIITYLILGMHFFINALLVYQILRVGKAQDKREIMNKDDLILFDEEENVKF